MREGTVDVKIKPGTKEIVDLELNRITNTECYLNLALRTKEDNSWSKAGHIIAEEQFVINEFENTYDELEPGEELVVADTYGSLRIFTEDINIRFERRERNQLYSVKVGGEESLAAPVRLNFWRALTDNDRGSRAGSRLGRWRDAGNAPEFITTPNSRLRAIKFLKTAKGLSSPAAQPFALSRNQRQ